MGIGGVIRFNYLGPSVPGAIDRLRLYRIPAAVRTPLWALATVSLAVVAWWAIEHQLLDEAKREVTLARARVESSREALARTKLERSDVDRYVALDRRLRTIRRSGAQLAARIAGIANQVPEHEWLLTISHSDSHVTITGEAGGFPLVGRTLANLATSATLSSPSLVRASSEERGQAGAVVFEIDGEASGR